MKKYSVYIFNQTTITFLGLISILISLIWFSKAITLVKFVTESGVGIFKFLSLFILILPWLLLFIVPISLFVAILISYSRLANNNEITILKNSGLTKLAISRPIISLVMLCSIACFGISFYLMPYANKKLRTERTNFQTNYTNIMFNPGVFESLKNLTIYIKNKDDQGKLFGILLNDKRSPSHSLTITAKYGSVAIKQSSVLLYMESGTLQKFNYKNNSSEILYFDSYVFNLNETQDENIATKWKVKERYLNELIKPAEKDVSAEDLLKYRAEIHKRIVYSLFSVILAMIAIASILFGQFNRKGNVRNIVFAIVMAGLFISISIGVSNLAEISTKYIPFLYLNLVAFFMVSFCALKINRN